MIFALNMNCVKPFHNSIPACAASTSCSCNRKANRIIIVHRVYPIYSLVAAHVLYTSLSQSLLVKNSTHPVAVCLFYYFSKLIRHTETSGCFSSSHLIVFLLFSSALLHVSLRTRTLLNVPKTSWFSRTVCSSLLHQFSFAAVSILFTQYYARLLRASLSYFLLAATAFSPSSTALLFRLAQETQLNNNNHHHYN